MCPDLLPKRSVGPSGGGAEAMGGFAVGEQEREAGCGTVNLMGQLDWAVVPTCCLEGILSVQLSKGDYPE